VPLAAAYRRGHSAAARGGGFQAGLAAALAAEDRLRRVLEEDGWLE